MKKDDLIEQNRLLKAQLKLLRRTLCKCPRDGWVIVGASILCPVHDMSGKLIIEVEE